MSGNEKPPINEILAVIHGIQTLKIDEDDSGMMSAVFNTLDDKMFVKERERVLRSAPLDPIVQDRVAKELMERVERNYLPMLRMYPEADLGESGFVAKDAIEQINDMLMREKNGSARGFVGLDHALNKKTYHGLAPFAPEEAKKQSVSPEYAAFRARILGVQPQAFH